MSRYLTRVHYSLSPECPWLQRNEQLIARLRIKILMASEPGDYVIYSQQTSHYVVVKADGSVKGGA
jgi:hypothetical protein